MLLDSKQQWQVSQVRQVSDALTVEKICRFRVEVWRGEGTLSDDAFPDGMWRDPIDSDAQHWLICDAAGRFAAAGRLTLHATLADVGQSEEYTRWGLDVAGPVASPDRVVVARFARAGGLGRRILDLQDDAAREQGARYAVRQASPRMVKLLQNRGWRVLGPASDDRRFPNVAFQSVVKEFS